MTSELGLGNHHPHTLLYGETILADSSCATATVIPSAMVFVPCKDGLSHNPEEYATPEDW